MNTLEHYDRLIDENNDPVHDPEVLKEHMDKWDGVPFFNALKLSPDKTVLEIGIGTGRIAVKTAPCCKALYGIDISAKTIERAKKNLAFADNVNLIAADYTDYKFNFRFDIIYSSLTLLHIENKQAFFNKVYSDLELGGRFVLSIDLSSQDEYLDMGEYKVKVFPDNPDDTEKRLLNAGFQVSDIIKTEFANVFVCGKAPHKIFGEKISGVEYFDRAGAYLIPIKDNKVAVARMPDGCYLLGGKIEQNETDEDCIKRECLEEIGYNALVGATICTAETYCMSDKVGYFHPIQVYHTGEILDKVQEPIENDHELEWLRLNKLSENMAVEIQLWAIEQAIKLLN